MIVRRMKYISVVAFLLGNVVCQGQISFADKQSEQEKTVALNHPLYAVKDSRLTQAAQTTNSLAIKEHSVTEKKEAISGVYNNIIYDLKGSELHLTGVASSNQEQEIRIDRSFLNAIHPDISKLILSPNFFYSMKGKSIHSIIISSSLNLVPRISDGQGGNVDLHRAFAGDEFLETVDFGATDFSEVINTSKMFENCSKLKTVQLSRLYATNLEGMFKNCPNLEQVKISENVTPMILVDMFNNCPKLMNIDGINQWTTTTIQKVEGIFLNCPALLNLDLSQWPSSLRDKMMSEQSNQKEETNQENTANGELAETNIPSQAEGVTVQPANTTTEWQYELSSEQDRYILTKYIGNNTEIVVPTSINGKPTSLLDIDSSIFPNYQSIVSFKIAPGNKVSIEDFDLRYAFQFWSSLKEVDLTGLDTSEVTNTGAMFANDPLLTKVNLSGWNTSNVTDMNYMFNGDKQLQELYLANWDVRQVTDMAYMFAHLSSLKTLDLSSFQTDKVSNMTSMFVGTTNLKLLNLSQFNLSNVKNVRNMFATSVKSPLLVLANDNKLLNYNYDADNRVLTGPVFDANGGVFEDQGTTKNYFQSVVITPTDPKLQMQTFNQFKDALVVKKPHCVFSDWQVNGVDNANNVTDLLTTTYQAVWITLPEIPSDTDNGKPGETSLFGLYYSPKQFSFPVTSLNETGKQQIPFDKQDSFDIGVCDKRQTSNAWTLQAQLVWTTAKTIPGSTIVLTNKGVVKKNINDGTSPFNPSTDLADGGNEIQGAALPEIETSKPVVIMEAHQATHDAIYNYNLGDAYLNIADTKNVQPGNYTGHVEWTLVQAP